MSAGEGVELAVTGVGLDAEHRIFLAREWQAADLALFGSDVDWVSRPLVVEARADGRLVGVAAGEVVAGMSRLNDLLVAEASRDQGVGAGLVEAFCAKAAELGAGRCFLRCPATERHQRFYERRGFVALARIPRYYHELDFVEYLREPLSRPAGP